MTVPERKVSRFVRALLRSGGPQAKDATCRYQRHLVKSVDFQLLFKQPFDIFR